jgi:queuine tRNA-ribosyltransferase subunit QTRTD1
MRRPRTARTPQASPEEALEGVLHGADLLDCSYPTHATANGYALCFPLRMPGEGNRGGDGAPGAGAGEGADDSKLNLWAQQYRLDRRPLVEGCGCFACASHTRAYVHHLLHAHEMLASVLLEAHNTHWWLAFFGEMRAAIEAGRLRDYAAWFKARRRAARGLSEAAGDAEAAPAPA